MARRSTPPKNSRKQKVAKAPSVAIEVILPADDLTDKQRMFIEQYFICMLNGTEAAMNSYDCKDRSVASVVASELLAHPKIRAQVDARLDQYHMAANELLARIAADARGTMEDFIDPASGTIDLAKADRAKALGLLKRYKTKFVTTTRTLAPISIADDEEKQARSVVEEVETSEIEIELYDGQAARRDLAKHLGLFIDKQEIKLIPAEIEKMPDEELLKLAAGAK